MLKKGVLVVLEGIDGSGKTTVAKILSRRLNTLGVENIITAEPYDATLKDIISKLDSSKKITPYLEAILFAADRLKHIDEVILPSIESGLLVICDRYYYSSLAYQGAQGVPLNWIYELNKYAPRPDIAFYLDIEPEEGLRRVGSGRDERTRFERLSLLKKARRIYLEIASREGMFVINTSARQPDQVADEILRILLKRIRTE